MQRHLILSNARNSRIGGGNKGLNHANSTNANKTHKLPKIALGLSLIFCSANIAFAEESGGFVGFGIGYGGTQFDIKILTPAPEDDVNFSEKNASGISYGFVAGYKQFFTPYLGLRYYANVDIWHNLSKQLNLYDDTKKQQDIMLINYGVNVDFLGNFISTESVDFGGFVGVGIGANSWSGKWLKDWEKSMEETQQKFTFTSFDAWLNVGLRTNIATNHGLEVAVRVPFLKTQLLKVSDEVSGLSAKFDIKQNYNILARYTFSF